MQRLGRKGHPTYRVVVQDSRLSPTSGKYVALLGSYDPHTKKSSLTKDRAQFYLDHGAQPSDRVVSLFKAEKITLPKWVNDPTKQDRQIRNPEKLRRNRPAEEPEASPQTEATGETVQEEAVDENPQDNESTKEESKEEKEVTETEKSDEPASESDQKSEEKPAEKQEPESSKSEEDKKSDKKEESSK